MLRASPRRKAGIFHYQDWNLHTIELRQDGETREELSFQVARSIHKGVYFARKIIEWERMWLRERRIQEGKRGCYAKTFSWANDEESR
jgi:hypothetical protein